MKYYSEEETKDLRLAFENEVLAWPHVGTKKMFGCPCYQANGRLFAFLVTKGLVITYLNEKDIETIFREYQTSFFQAGKKTVRNWVKISVQNNEALRKIMPFVRKSYQAALVKTKL